VQLHSVTILDAAWCSYPCSVLLPVLLACRKHPDTDLARYADTTQARIALKIRFSSVAAEHFLVAVHPVMVCSWALRSLVVLAVAGVRACELPADVTLICVDAVRAAQKWKLWHGRVALLELLTVFQAQHMMLLSDAADARVLDLVCAVSRPCACFRLRLRGELPCVRVAQSTSALTDEQPEVQDAAHKALVRVRVCPRVLIVYLDVNACMLCVSCPSRRACACVTGVLQVALCVSLPGSRKPALLQKFEALARVKLPRAAEDDAAVRWRLSLCR
jgi:hypothetical protein